MQSDLKYIKNDKVYQVKKKAWRPHKVRVWLLLPLLLLIALGGYCAFSALGIEKTGTTEYKVVGDIDYKVYLKPNDYYQEKYLDKGMQYIANLISVVRVDFDYELDTQDDVQANYEYQIVAETKATDRNDKSKVLHEKSDVLKLGKVQPMSDGKIEVRDSVNLDYGKYNDYMRNFRNEFGIAANCEVDLKMVVKVSGGIETEDKLAMAIPLSEQTVDIAIDTQGIERTEKIGDERTEISIRNWPLLITGIVIVVVSLILVIAVIYYYATRYNDDLYEKALHKILKEYDTYIVEGSETIYELENVVRVASFKELLDAQNLENTPIVFLEVVPGEKSYFIVNGVNTTYRYTLSRAYQDKLAAEGESEF